MIVTPAYASAVYLVTPRVLRSSRDNVLGEDISDTVAASLIDHDIDRAGAKSQINVELTDSSVLSAGDWIAPFVEVVPEHGDVQVSQRGLYQIDDPTITYSGVGPAMAQATGSDIIATYERMVLQESQVTPPSCVVGPEVRFALEAADTGRWGPDLAVNGNFESWADPSSPSGWLGSAYGGAVSPSRARFTGAKVTGSASMAVSLDGDGPLDSVSYAYSTAHIPIPAGRPLMLLEGFIAPGSGTLQGWLGIEWWDATTPVSSSRSNIVTLQSAGDYLVWERAWVFASPPAAATRFRITLSTRLVVNNPGVKSMHFDKVAIRAVGRAPLRRASIPSIPARTSTDISHDPGATWHSRINDLLANAGHHAIHALPDGRPTTRPQRDPRSETPVRTYELGSDLRVVGNVVTSRARTGFYNVVVAIREDYETGEVLKAVARNDDANHPWSTVRHGEAARPDPIMVTDATDQKALQAIADAELARASMQDSITLEVLPDLALTVHDVIEVTGPPGPAIGRWAIESMREGQSHADPLLMIEARRVLTPTRPESTS